MKKIAWLAILLLTTGCANMTAREKQTAYIISAIIVTGAIVASQSKSDPVKQNCFIPFPNGSLVCVNE